MQDMYRRRELFDDEHEAFRETVHEFVKREVAGHVGEWEEQEVVPRELWLRAGEQGLLGTAVPESLGGGGVDDYRFRVAIIEELTRVGANSVTAGFSLQSDIALRYLVDLGTAEQGKRWVPAMVRGESIGAIAMTEPGTGSDLQGIRTTARRDGGGWVLNGSKTFITNGINAGLVIVVARTYPDPRAGSRAFSLLVVESGTAGFTRGRRLKKIGLKGQDTAELNFAEVRLPSDSLLGGQGGGFRAPDDPSSA